MFSIIISGGKDISSISPDVDSKSFKKVSSVSLRHCEAVLVRPPLRVTLNADERFWDTWDTCNSKEGGGELIRGSKWRAAGSSLELEPSRPFN